jgi:DNA polymerase-1
MGDRALLEWLQVHAAVPGSLVAIAVHPGTGLGAAVERDREHDGIAAASWAAADPSALVLAAERVLGPRWVEWDGGTAGALVASGVRVARCWDVAAVHRLIHGGWRADPARAWAAAVGLPTETIPLLRPPDLFSTVLDDGDPDDPVGRDGHLRPEWVAGAWRDDEARLARWASAALLVAGEQHAQLDALQEWPRAQATARSESAAELLCAELAHDGLPMDRHVAERIVASVVGPRPRDADDEAAQRAARDATVLDAAPPGTVVDLRNPAQVRSLLRRVGVEVPDTRSWRLEAVRDVHPVVDALLRWRKAERVATTYGYGWLDAHLGADGRLRGEWTGADGAAGRMTASAGLHNMPAEMRSAVVAEPGHVFVRADLGQIEPRVLAAVSGDAALAAAADDDDMYLPVATALGVDRATAKVAVLGAMYGQTTGQGAVALRRLQAAYPVAMAYLDDADRAAQVSRDLRTYGGRLVRMGRTNANDVSERDARSHAAARGRYGRNAMVQGAAAELFKVWAVTVRARCAVLGATIVLCLHDELLVHVPEEAGERTAALVDDCLGEAAHRWAPGATVRFLADTSIVRAWSDASA